MKSLKTLLFGLILCLLIAVKVQSQTCFDGYNSNESWSVAPLSYSLPNPLVNITLTVFNQNPTFMNDVTEVSNQIAQQIETAIQEQERPAPGILDSLLSMFTIGIVSGLGLGNDGQSGQTQTDIAQLLTTLTSVIGQEVAESITQALDNIYNSNFDSYLGFINRFDEEISYSTLSPSEMQLQLQTMQTQLLDINDALFGALSNFETNPAFNCPACAYYTAQPLYINAMLHINVLSLLALVDQALELDLEDSEQALGQEDSESSSESSSKPSSEYYQQLAISLATQNYSILLQNYSSQAGSYRAGFIANVTCELSCVSVPVSQNGIECARTYSFEDNFLPANNSTVLTKTYPDRVPGINGSAVLAAQSSYVQAVESGTTAYFDQFATSVLNYNPNQGSASLLFV